MNYIIFDLEYNQQHPDEIGPKGPKPPLLFEVIQIGAIKLNKNFKTISTFNSLVKPQIHTTLHPYVEKLTNITIDELNNCSDFKSVYNDFVKFIGDEENILVVWGNSDITELVKNIEYFNLSTSNLSKKYIDIQTYAGNILKVSKGQKVGLQKAVESFNIPVEGDFHDAYYDAHYTSEVFKCIYNKKIIPTTFIKSNDKRTKTKKEKLNSNALIKEFEKIYKRNMSKEEIQMIRLAYFMGKTKQFIKKDE